MAAEMTGTYYESDQAVREYLLFHFGGDAILPRGANGPREALHFPERCAALHRGHCANQRRALDLGCAVGGATYAMSSDFKTVVGIDFSHSLIAAAQRIGQAGTAQIELPDEGDLMQSLEVRLPPGARPERVRFQQGDAQNLPSDLGQFDYVLLANLIDRLPDPAACLASIHTLLAPGGVLAITSPYTWLEEYTPRDKWLGGRQENARPLRTLDSLHNILQPAFEPIGQSDLPFLIREHARKCQYTVAQASLWRRRSG